MCADLPGTKGRLLDHCRHLYCTECVAALPESQHKCALCNRRMLALHFHQCGECCWALMVEAGGAGKMRFVRIEEHYSIRETQDIIASGAADGIRRECLKEVLKKLPLLDNNGVCRLMIARSLQGGARWYPLFEGRENPEEDMFVCSSRELYRNHGCGRNAVIAGKWEGIERVLYYSVKLSCHGGKHIMRGKKNCGPIEGMKRNEAHTPPPRMLVALEEFAHRMGWV